MDDYITRFDGGDHLIHSEENEDTIRGSLMHHRSASNSRNSKKPENAYQEYRYASNVGIRLNDANGIQKWLFRGLQSNGRSQAAERTFLHAKERHARLKEKIEKAANADYKVSPEHRDLIEKGKMVASANREKEAIAMHHFYRRCDTFERVGIRRLWWPNLVGWIHHKFENIPQEFLKDYFISSVYLYFKNYETAHQLDGENKPDVKKYRKFITNEEKWDFLIDLLWKRWELDPFSADLTKYNKEFSMCESFKVFLRLDEIYESLAVEYFAGKVAERSEKDAEAEEQQRQQAAAEEAQKQQQEEEKKQEEERKRMEEVRQQNEKLDQQAHEYFVNKELDREKKLRESSCLDTSPLVGDVGKNEDDQYVGLKGTNRFVYLRGKSKRGGAAYYFLTKTGNQKLACCKHGERSQECDYCHPCQEHKNLLTGSYFLAKKKCFRCQQPQTIIKLRSKKVDVKVNNDSTQIKFVRSGREVIHYMDDCGRLSESTKISKWVD